MWPAESFFTAQDWISKMSREAERDKQRWYRNTTANQRFRELLQRHNVGCTAYKMWRLENTYVWDNKVVFSIQPDTFSDCNLSHNYLWYLNKFYVRDDLRMQGIGTRFLNELKSWADSAGIIFCFLAHGYGFSKFEEQGPFYLDKIADIIDCFYDEQIVDADRETHELLKFFYSSGGFQNGCIYDAKFTNDHPLEDQFIYIGKNAEHKYKLEISYRLGNETNCEYCTG